MDDLEGIFVDPKHGHCLRRIGRGETPSTYVLFGAYGDDEPPHQPGSPWEATVHRDGKFLTVDFHSKSIAHARVYAALWCPAVRELHWEDGNVWKKVYFPR